MRRRGAGLSILVLGVAAAGIAAAADSPYGRAFYDPAEPAFPGVTDMRRAWQNWTLNCQGCHRADGSGSAGTAPPIQGTVARFLMRPADASTSPKCRASRLRRFPMRRPPR